ncbi:S8 family serine peptidase [Longispora urticae]
MTPRQTTRRALFAALGLTVATLAVGAQASSAAPAEGVVRHGASQPIPGSYVIVLKESALRSAAPRAIEATAGALATKYQGTLGFTYTAALHGFSVKNMTERQARRLAADPQVAQVAQDGTARLLDTQTNPPSYGLDRIDQKDLPLDKSFTYAGTGEGVTAYVIDSGIRIGHQEFEGRASVGADFIEDGQNGNDCFGHGTHVSGTIGGKTVGVAKKVKLVAVRALGTNCGNTGPDSAAIKGFDWITQNGVKPAVVNMSFGFDDAHIGDQALQNSIAAGFTYVAAAGNNGSDGCSFGPGGTVKETLDVGNSNATDNRSGTSNYGKCLDLFAPGENIYSAGISSNTAYANMTGTSMASPHVAGGAALYLQNHKTAAPAEVHAAVVNAATPGKIKNPGTGSPNLLLYTKDFGGGNPQPTNDFSIAVNPTSGSVDAGSALTTTVSTAVVTGSAETVALTASGLPTGATGAFDPASVTAGGTSKLTLSTTADTKSGTYTVTVQGKSASATHTAAYTLTVRGTGGGNDFSISLSPATATVRNGESATSTVSTAVTGGSAETVALSAAGLPSGVTATFAPDSVTAGNTAKLTLATTTATATGSYSITVTGRAASATHDTTFVLNVKATVPGGEGVTNGGFETGTLSGWTGTGTTSAVGGGRTGAYAASVGGGTGASSISQTFTVPAGKSQLNVYVLTSNCDPFAFEMATATLVDTATGSSRSLIQLACMNGGFWFPGNAGVTAGKSYTLTLTMTNTSAHGVAKFDDATLS